MQVVGEIELLSHPSEQLEYEQSLTHGGHAPTELIEMFCSRYHPKSPEFLAAFTVDELCDLAHLYGLLREVARTPFSTVSEMLKDRDWRRVVTLAQELITRFR